MKPEFEPELLQERRSGSKLIAYLQLFRAPNVFTAIADVAMGYLVTAPRPVPMELALLFLASSTLYTSGMVLNDVFDYDVDTQERPHRPLPSGRISRQWARWLGLWLLAAGVIAAWLAGLLYGTQAAPVWRAGLIATALALCILLYNGGAKKTIVGCVVMGACRFLNILMGMSLHGLPGRDTWQVLHFGTEHLMIAGAIGVYIIGVTVFARSEAARSPRGPLVFGVLIIIGALVMLGAFPILHPEAFRYRISPGMAWPMAVFITSMWFLRRCVVAIANPEPARVQYAVKFCLLSLIVIDATILLLLCPPTYALLIFALLVPAMLLGHWVYST